jgi:hypothetical protein
MNVTAVESSTLATIAYDNADAVFNTNRSTMMVTYKAFKWEARAAVEHSGAYYAD